MHAPLTAAQQELVKKNLDLAHFLAQEAFRRNRTELEIEEVVSVAYQGLVRAAQRFDPSRMSAETVANGKAFAGFARQKINGAILDWQREIDHVQRTYRQWYKQLQKLGYVPYESTRSEVQEYAQTMGLEHEKLVLIIRAVENTTVSFDSTDIPLSLGSWGEQKYVGVRLEHEADSTVESDAAGNQITRAFSEAYDRLPDQQKQIIALRYYANEEFQYIASEMETSLTAIRDAHAEAVHALHQAMSRAASDSH